MKVKFNHYKNQKDFKNDLEQYKDTGTLEGTISFVRGEDGKDNKIFLGSEEYCSGSSNGSTNQNIENIDLGTF